MIDVDDQIDDVKLENIINIASKKIVERRLECPAIFFLEMNKPLAFIASQGFLVAAPMLGALVGSELVFDISKALRQPGTVEKLILKIEELASVAKDKPISLGENQI